MLPILSIAALRLAYVELAQHPLAQQITAQDEATEPTSSPFGVFFPLILLGAFFYFFFIRPQRKRMRDLGAMRSQIEIGDEVRTAGGIFGVVTDIFDDSVNIDVGGGTHIRFHRDAIASRLTDSTDYDEDE